MPGASHGFKNLNFFFLSLILAMFIIYIFEKKKIIKEETKILQPLSYFGVRFSSPSICGLYLSGPWLPAAQALSYPSAQSFRQLLMGTHTQSHPHPALEIGSVCASSVTSFSHLILYNEHFLQKPKDQSILCATWRQREDGKAEVSGAAEGDGRWGSVAKATGEGQGSPPQAGGGLRAELYAKLPRNRAFLVGMRAHRWRQTPCVLEHGSIMATTHYTPLLGVPSNLTTSWVLLPVCSKETEAQRSQATCPGHKDNGSGAWTLAHLWISQVWIFPQCSTAHASSQERQETLFQALWPSGGPHTITFKASSPRGLPAGAAVWGGQSQVGGNEQVILCSLLIHHCTGYCTGQAHSYGDSSLRGTAGTGRALRKVPEAFNATCQPGLGHPPAREALGGRRTTARLHPALTRCCHSSTSSSLRRRASSKRAILAVYSASSAAW